MSMQQKHYRITDELESWLNKRRKRYVKPPSESKVLRDALEVFKEYEKEIDQMAKDRIKQQRTRKS